MRERRVASLSVENRQSILGGVGNPDVIVARIKPELSAAGTRFLASILCESPAKNWTEHTVRVAVSLARWQEAEEAAFLEGDTRGADLATKQVVSLRRSLGINYVVGGNKRDIERSRQRDERSVEASNARDDIGAPASPSTADGGGRRRQFRIM